MRYPALELGVGMMFALVALVVRPLLVPVFLAATSGGIATATAWLIHGSFDRKIAATSTAFVAVIAVATAGVGAVASI